MQSPTGETPISLCTCTTAWCSNILPWCSTPAPFNPTFSYSFPARFHRHPQMHTCSPTETLTKLVRGWESFQHKPPTLREGQAASRVEPQQQPSFPPHSASQVLCTRLAPTEERVTHCKVTLLLWIAGKTSEWLPTLLKRPGGLRVRVSIFKHRTLAPLHSYLHFSSLLNLVHAWTCPFTTPTELKAWTTWNIRGPTKTIVTELDCTGPPVLRPPLGLIQTN